MLWIGSKDRLEKVSVCVLSSVGHVGRQTHVLGLPEHEKSGEGPCSSIHKRFWVEELPLSSTYRLVS